MKYRILEELYSDGRYFCIPQFKYKYVPYWFCYQSSQGRVSFCSCKDAFNYINQRREVVTITKTIHNVD